MLLALIYFTHFTSYLLALFWQNGCWPNSNNKIKIIKSRDWNHFRNVLLYLPIFLQGVAGGTFLLIWVGHTLVENQPYYEILLTYPGLGEWFFCPQTMPNASNHHVMKVWSEYFQLFFFPSNCKKFIQIFLKWGTIIITFFHIQIRMLILAMVLIRVLILMIIHIRILILAIILMS